MKKKNTILEVIISAATSKDEHVYCDYLKISEQKLIALQTIIGDKVNLQYHTITSDEIRHAYNKHSKDICAVEWSDFALIPLIVSDPDEIEFIGLAKQNNNKLILFKKKINNIYFVVEEARNGREKLVVKTFYKNKAKKRGDK